MLCNTVLVNSLAQHGHMHRQDLYNERGLKLDYHCTQSVKKICMQFLVNWTPRKFPTIILWYCVNFRRVSKFIIG